MAEPHPDPLVRDRIIDVSNRVYPGPLPNPDPTEAREEIERERTKQRSPQGKGSRES